jgi:GTP 3',8-cyclase
MPESGIEKCPHDSILTFEEIDNLVEQLVQLGIDKVRITGGEPLVRKDIIQLLERIGRHKSITDFSITTNGMLLKRYAKELKAAGVHRVNVSLDSLNSEKFAAMTRGGDLALVLEGIEEAIKVGLLPIKLNVVLIGGFNDDEIEDFVELTRNQPIDVRFIELMPIGEVASWSLDNFISNKHVLNQCPDLHRTEQQDKSSPAVYYKLSNAKGRVGLISPISCKFCHGCNRIRLTSEGGLKYCLHSEDTLDVKEILARKGNLELEIKKFLAKKPLDHSLEKGRYIKQNMVRIGG